ncbi:MAG: hypothetical protein M0R22_08140 [Dehalococcoidia bacterium]|jgi:hypothetical protein|nr:hypothetical protein [Dehalococcoidia bacterium]
MTFKTVHQAADAQFLKIYDSAYIATATQGTAVDLEGRSPIRLLMPAGWETTAAIVHIDVSDDGTNYYELWSAGTAYTVAVKKSVAVRVDPEVFWGCQWIRLVGTRARGTAEAQATQGTIGIVARLI